MELITTIRYPYTTYVISDGVDIFIIRREKYSKRKLLAVINGYRKQGYEITHDKTGQTKTKNILNRLFPRNIVKKIMGLPYRDTNSNP